MNPDHILPPPVRDTGPLETMGMRVALLRAIETLAASRHLIGKYTPEHHWLPEHDQRIAELRAALGPIDTKEGE